MHANAFDSDFGGSRIEVFILQVANVASIHGVRPLAPELLHIEMMCAHTDLLIRIEAHTNVAVLNLRMVAEIAHCLHDLSHTRLVVSPEQRGAVSHNQVFALVLQQLREFLWRGDDARRKLNVTAIVVLYDTRLNISAAGVECGIVMGNEPDRRRILSCIAGKRGVDITHIVHFHIF